MFFWRNSRYFPWSSRIWRGWSLERRYRKYYAWIDSSTWHRIFWISYWSWGASKLCTINSWWRHGVWWHSHLWGNVRRNGNAIHDWLCFKNTWIFEGRLDFWIWEDSRWSINVWSRLFTWPSLTISILCIAESLSNESKFSKLQIATICRWNIWLKIPVANLSSRLYFSDLSTWAWWNNFSWKNESWS